MKSYWSIVCSGSSSKIVIKKLERVLHLKVVVEKTQRVIMDDRKFEAVDFFIDNSSIDNWNDFVAHILKLSSRLSSRWSICIGNEDLVGSYDPFGKNQISTISGLSSATWQISNNQEWRRGGVFSGDGLDMW